MGSHRRVPAGDMFGQHQCHRWRLAGSLTRSFQRQAHGVGMRHVALQQRLAQGSLQRPSAVAVHKTQQLRRDRAQAVAGLAGALEKLGAGGCGLCQAVAGAVRAGRAFVIDQRFDVDGLLDLLASIPAAHVARQCLCAVQDADSVFVGQHAQGSATWVYGTE